uniref:Msx2-interacting protein n=1 Tax=Parascaris univalens TaxID=6257 RepID=A0A915BDK5_PARUN
MDSTRKGTVPDSLRGVRSVVEAGDESRSNSWSNSFDDDVESANSLNSLIATLRQQHGDQVAGATESRSAFTATSSVGQNSEMESATCSGPAVKRVRRTNHVQKHPAQSTASLSAVEANGAPAANNSPNLEYFLQIQRIYQTSLLNNTLASNPELVLRLQQLNALQQAFNTQSVLSLQPNLLSGSTVGVHEQRSMKPSSINATHQAGASNLALNALLAPVAQNSTLSLLSSLIRHINANSEQSSAMGISSVEANRQPTFSSPNVQRDSSMPDESWNTFDPTAFYNLLLQQQCVAAALAAKQTTASSLPVVVNGQDNELSPATTAVLTSPAVSTTNATQNSNSVCTRRLQQIPVCRRALEARFARILAQELEASDEEHDRHMEGKVGENLDAMAPKAPLSDVERKTFAGLSAAKGRATKSASPTAADLIGSHCQQADICVTSATAIPVELSAECTSTLKSSSVDGNKSEVTQQPDTPPLVALSL